MDPEITVAIVGPKRSGKTCLAYRFVYGTYVENVLTYTACNIWQKNVWQNGKKVSVEVWDTVGHDMKSSINRSVNNLRNKHAIVITFDVTEKSSFVKVRSWLDFARANTDSHTYVVIVGTKCGSRNRVVTLEELKKFASDNSVNVFETSALVGFGIDELFATILNIVFFKNLHETRQERQGLQQPRLQLSQQSSGPQEPPSSATEERPVRARRRMNVWVIIRRVLQCIPCAIFRFLCRGKRRQDDDDDN